MKSIYEKGLAELQAELSLLEGEPIEPIERLRHTLPLISGVINEIKVEVLKSGFESSEDEIHFFKEVKPGFYALQLFEISWYNLSVNKTVGTLDMVKAFYEEELLNILRFFRTNAFHYQYYRTRASELDAQYFMRDARPMDIPILEMIDPLPGFSTALDYLFAKFMAYERLQLFLIDQLTALYSDKGDKSLKPKLRWTGEKINLIELAYGIHFMAQLNDGKAELMEIIAWLNESLGLDLSPDRAYRMFLDIKRRKSISPTRFIDQMREAIQQHIQDSFGLKKIKINR